ncbi:MAG: AI-2E family transporter [Actinomycetota bacterium]|nr:AI-2E family transporter [Actinomycetota bacterium]
MTVWEQLTTRQLVRILSVLLAFLVGLFLLYKVRDVLLVVGIAVFLSVAFGPAVDVLARGRVPRSAAILAVYAALVAVIVGVGLLVVPPVVDQLDQLAGDLPGFLNDLRANATFREFDARYGIVQTLQEQASSLPSRLGDAAGTLQSVTVGAFNAVFELVTVLTIAFFLLLDRKRIVALSLGLAGERRAPELVRVGGRIYRSTAGYVAGALTIAAINGLVTFVTLTILGVPFAVPLSVLMFFFGLIPLVGATIGGAIILLVTLFTVSLTSTIVYLVVLVVYQQVENSVLQPFVYKRTVDVPPLVVIVSILVGTALLGVLGALVAIPVAAGVQILLREYGPEPLRLTPPPPPAPADEPEPLPPQ